MTPTQVVFDIGNVLVDWQPAPVWLDELGSPTAVAAFMDRINFGALNLRCDGGETFAAVASELADPEDARLLALYPSRFHLTIKNEVPGTWGIVDKLQAKGVPLHAITNWSAETWPIGFKAHPRLGTMFKTTIVSGDVGLIKPDPAIYELFLRQSGCASADCVFIDDKPENVEAAKSVGMQGIHFTGAVALERGLTEFELL